MPNAYSELKKRHQADVNAFPMVFAFSNSQFEEGMAKLGLLPTDTDMVYKFGSTGGFYRKTDAAALHEMFDRHEREMTDAITADTTGKGFIFEMFSYELANHEYIVTGDVEPALNALGLSEDDVLSNPALLRGLKLALKAQREPKPRTTRRARAQ